MKKIAIFSLVIIGMLFSAYAEQQSFLQPNITVVYRYKEGGIYKWATTDYSNYLGRYNGKMGKDEETFRIILKYDLTSIPDSALMRSVTLCVGKINVDTLHFSYKIQSFDPSVSGAENMWNASENGTVYRSSINTDSTSSADFFSYTNWDDSLFIGAMERALPGNQFALCIKSYSESENRKFAIMSVGNALISYSVPTIKIVNSFNSGTVKINGVAYNSGIEIQTKIGRQFTIEANSQIFMDTMRHFESWLLPTGYNTGTNPYQFTMTKANSYSTQVYTAIFGNPVPFFVENSFEGGVIKVDNDTVLSGSKVERGAGSTVLLGSINQDYGGYDRVWNNFAPQNTSIWQKGKTGQVFIDIKNAVDPSYSFQISKNDTNATYRAKMWRNYRISRNDDFREFDNLVNRGIVTRVVESNTGTLSAPADSVINGRHYYFAGWSDGVRNNPRTITPANNTAYTALYKLPLFTNNNDAFQTNNQRKFIRTHNYELIRTYSSMNRIWLEKSTDNGTSWSLLNLGSSISGTGADYPSLVQIDQSMLLIVYLESSMVKAVLYDLAYEQIRDTYLIKDIYVGGGIPVVTASRDGQNNFMVVWNEVEGGEWYPGGLHYFYGKIITGGSGYPVISEISAGLMSGTTGNSVNPAIGIRIAGASYPLYYHLAWEESNAGGSVIKYCKITGASNETLSFSSIQTISTGSGYTINRNPSIIADNGTEARVCWQGYRSWSEIEKEDEESGGGDMYEEWRVVFRATDNNYFWNFGTYVNLPVISRNDGWSYYSLVWSENSGGNLPVKFADNTLSTVRQTNIQGRDVMLSNGTNSSSMYVNTINRASSPFGLLHSSSLGSFYKPNSVNIATRREGILQKDEAEFYFMLGDVLKDGEVVNFKKIEDGEEIGDIRGYLETEEIEVNNQSQLEFGVQYGIKDTSKARTLFNEGLEISFGIELVDSETGEIIGNFNEVNFNSVSVNEYKVEGYQLDMTGIGDRSIKLRLKAIDNRNCNLTLVTKYSDETVLSKKGNKQISYNGNVIVTDYSLSQNYPNPFNPSTVIKYELPKANHVTLKVYDILGKEVAALVDREQEQGRYEVSFDGSKLSSGVYICRITAGEFVKSIKMNLIK